MMNGVINASKNVYLAFGKQQSYLCHGFTVWAADSNRSGEGLTNNRLTALQAIPK